LFVWLHRPPALKRARVRFRTSRAGNVVVDALNMKFVTARKLLYVKSSQWIVTKYAKCQSLIGGRMRRD
jgi:hypothetical protein